MSERLARYIEKSKEQLAGARIIVANTATSAVAVHNCYYAYFWLIRGLLLERGVVTKKHSGAHQMFGLHFIKSGEIPAHFSDYLFDLFEQRQIADYDLDGEFDPEQVQELINKADEFLTFVQTNYA